jgi:DNA-binding SARP family transcriptional activator
MDFGLLGPVEVRRRGEALPLGSGRQRFVLATLLLNAGRLTLAERLVDSLWAEPPSSARAQLHNMISNLRRRLEAGGDRLIVTRPSGYELHLGPHTLDVLEFRRLVDRGREAAAGGDHTLAAAELARALALWRGPAFADVPDELAAGLRQALHEERFAAAEARLDAELAAGHHDLVLVEVAELIREQPYRERLYQARMLALAAVGRQADALDAYRQAYRRFVDDLGVEPGPVLRDLERRILRGEAPNAPVLAGSAGPAVPRQLPPATGTLTGRDKLIDELLAELRPGEGAAPQVAVLTGPGGIGKTALAVAVARRLERAFPDGQLFADLRGSQPAPADPHSVLGRFLRALGVEGASVPDDHDERVAMYRSRLGDSRTLVVLDDAASEDQVRPLLPGGAGCAVLVTSRRQLGGLTTMAARCPVPVLTTADSVELLGRLVGRDRLAAEPDAAADVAELCGHLPLAVSIAGARLAVRPDWRLEDFRLLLAESRGRLDELTVGDLDVRASIALSYRALSPELRRLFRRLGLVGAPDWPDWVAGAVLRCPAPDGGQPAARMVDQLVDAHLVQPLGRDAVGQHRFRLHDLVAAFAREQVTAEDERAARRVPRTWLALATEADELIDHGMVSAAGLVPPDPAPGEAAWPARELPLDWFETERANLVAAVEQACRLDDPEVAGQLALRLAGFLFLRAYEDDRDRALQAALGCARAHVSDGLLLRLLNAMFALRASQSRDHELRAIAAEQLSLARQAGDRPLEIRALTNLGIAARRLGHLTEAIDRLDAALAACGPDPPGALVVKVLNEMSKARLQAGRAHEAAAISARALATELESPIPRQTMMYLEAYGYALMHAGRLPEAQRAFTDAMAIVRETGDDPPAASVERALAEIDIRQRRWQAAAERLDRALRTLTDDRGDPAEIADVLLSQADLASARDRPLDALEPLRRALAIWRKIGAPLEVARTLVRLELATRSAGPAGSPDEFGREWRAILRELELDEACLNLPPFLAAARPA